jgi:interferon-induced GTP-binding protein Mx1
VFGHFKETASSNFKTMALELVGNEDYRAFMDKLVEFNVDKYVDLPMIAVMGDTSSGKSSLLSMISTIELPKSEQLTTRCPIMLQMHHAEETVATIGVQWKDKCSSSDADTFEIKTVNASNWHEITSLITDAQDHIIRITGKEVARDIVSIDMRGPHCENLTLIDLPGIVRSTGIGESSSLSHDIQSLLDDYLKNDRCVILAVLPSNVDFHNSQILALARTVDPGTSRTIPVLTKPDIIDAGAEDGVKELLLGLKTEKFEKGFHMVKGRGQEALKNNVSIVDALQQEENFFRTREPWKSLSDQNLFGTKSLRVKLGELQMRLVRDSFPSIISEMKERVKTAEESLLFLGHVPESPQERRNVFARIKEHMARNILVHGCKENGKQMRVTAEFHTLSSEFQNAIRLSQLARISDVTRGTKIIYLSGGDDIETEAYHIDEEEGLVYVPIPNAKPETSSSPVGTVEKDSKGKRVISIVRDDELAHKVKGIAIQKVRRSPHWLMDLIQANRSLNLPIFMDSEVFDHVVRHLVEAEWEEPCRELVEQVSELLTAAAEACVRSNTAVAAFPNLKHFLKLTAIETIDTLKQKASDKVDDFLSREKNIPYTQNHYLVENISKYRFKKVRDAIADKVHAYPSGDDGRIEKSKTVELVKSVFARHEMLSLDTHVAEEMQHALNAYGKVAMKRFIDVVPMICMDILSDFPKRFEEALLDVQDCDLERLVRLSSESMTKYKNLKKEVETLRTGLNFLRRL